MPARDAYHDVVRRALVKDGWTITHDPYTFAFGLRNLFVDLGAEWPLAAEIGWEGPKRVHGTVIHIDIHDGKIWIHHDGTSAGVAEDLAAAGVPRDHIVLGWQVPELRKHTAYAVA